MRPFEVLKHGDEHLRVGPWRGAEGVGCLAPIHGRPTPSAALIEDGVRRLRADGFRTIVTSALTVVEQRPFLDVGFARRESLHLLAHSLDHIPDAPHHRIRRTPPRKRPEILEVDAAAFEPFWRLDERGFADAIAATPISRIRIARDADGIAGYAVFGRAGRRGFLQRLAVHPRAQRQGFAQALVVDGLTWIKRRRGNSVVVNTQESNAGALDLYRSLGFQQLPEGLAVLQMNASL